MEPATPNDGVDGDIQSGDGDVKYHVYVASIFEFKDYRGREGAYLLKKHPEKVLPPVLWDPDEN